MGEIFSLYLAIFLKMVATQVDSLYVNRSQRWSIIILYIPANLCAQIKVFKSK
jgi:hypothetical protein